METPKITSFKQIKEIIEPIPADQFCTDTFEDDKGCCCFLGHINKHLTGSAIPNINDWHEKRDGFGARALTTRFIEEVHKVYGSGVHVNNSPNINGYNEPEIKDRLMHMIEDGIKWEESKN